MGERRQPWVGEVVHYVSHGTPGGEYGPECRPAIVTGQHGASVGASLVVFARHGLHFQQYVNQRELTTQDDPRAEYPSGSWHRATHERVEAA